MRLAQWFAAWRHENRMPLRTAAAKIGVSVATLQRFEKGEAIEGRTLAKLLTWVLS